MAPKRDKELILQIARMRFEDRYAQREIARRLRISEATVSRALKEAFELDLIEVRIRMATDRNTTLERALVKRFGLQRAVVVENHNEPRHTLTALGRVVGEMLALDLVDDLTIGVGDGESAAAVAAGLPHLWLRNVEVVPLIGGVGQLDVATHPVEIAREVAKRLNGRLRQLPAPAVMPDASAASHVMRASAVADAFEAMKRCRLALVGIGPIDRMTSMVRHGALTLSELEAIAALGAVGMICARAYDQGGRHILSDLDARTLAISFEDFKKIPMRWVIGTGSSKIPALHAAFTGTIVTACGVDAATASQLLAI